jgi:hypothetical protein
MTVYCGAGHVIGDYLAVIAEKYPFYCDECDEDCRMESYPWHIDAHVFPVPEYNVTDYVNAAGRIK